MDILDAEVKKIAQLEKNHKWKVAIYIFFSLVISIEMIQMIYYVRLARQLSEKLDIPFINSLFVGFHNIFNYQDLFENSDFVLFVVVVSKINLCVVTIIFFFILLFFMIYFTRFQKITLKFYQRLKDLGQM